MLEFLICFIGFGLFLGVILGWWIIDGHPKAQTNALKQKFSSLGNLRGKTITQIEQVVGKPSTWYMVMDKRLCVWQTQRYHITLVFNGDICEGVESEISV